MLSYMRFPCLFLIVFLIISCAGTGRSPDYSYEADAIRITMRADQRLNLYQGSPHTLIACIYQLKDPNSFNQIADEKDGLPRLLECTRFDPTVAYVKRMIIQPDQIVKESIDRAEGARYVGVVTGYYRLQKKSTTRLYRIPIGTLSRKADNLDIDIYLGPQAIQDSKVR